MLNPRQERVFIWLKQTLNLPVFAESYKGAIILLNRKPPGYINSIAHTGRDFMNGLAPTVANTKRNQVQYSQLVDKIQVSWDNEWGGGGLVPRDNSTDDKGHYIPDRTCEDIQKLIDEHNDGRNRSKNKDTSFFFQFFKYDNDRNKIPANFLEEWSAARNWFVKYAHLRKEDFPKNAHAEVVRHFRTLDESLHIAATSARERLKDINEILEKTNC